MIRAHALPPPSKPPEHAAIQPAHQSHLKDASFFSGTADKIFFPNSDEEIAFLLKEAGRSKMPVTVSGAGTGLTGARVPQGGAVLSTERMNRILSIHWDGRSTEGRAVVQPGVLLKDLERALEEKSLFYPPNPGEKAASIGGTVATNASGSRSFKYGPTRRYVQRLKIILPNGELLECARGAARETNSCFKIGLSDGKTVEIPVPSYPMPSCKNAAGYFAAAGMDLIDLFIGAEGTLGIVTEIELAVLKKPAAVVSGILFFSDEKTCYPFCEGARRAPFDPRVLEFLDSRSLAFLAQKHTDIPSGAGAALYFEQECTREQTESIRRSWASAATNRGAFSADDWLSSDAKRQNDFRTFRYNLPVLVNEQVQKNGFRKIATDMAVPPAQGKTMFEFYLATLGGCGIGYCLFGHLGENHLHANLLPKTEPEFARSKEIYEALARKAVSLGGTVSAEHGIGKLRIPYLEIMVGKAGLLQMARVKKALDPDGILNRGNIVPAELLAMV